MGLIFSATSLDECLRKAANELNISKQSIKYTITKEERRFFKKKIEIEVLEDKADSEINIEQEKILQSIKEKLEDKKNSGAKVQDGEIIITESKKSDDIITIKSCEGVMLFVNGEKCDNITPVTSSDKIEYKFKAIDPVREANVFITNNNMEAYITIQSIPKYEYRLSNQGYCKNLILEKELISEEYLPKYSFNELKQILNVKGICYGILEEQLKLICNENEVNNVLIAKGQPAKDDIPEDVDVLFKESDELVDYKDTEEKINYRNRYLIPNVNAGDIIGRKVPGKMGKDGVDILGKTVKRNSIKKTPLRIGAGCKLQNEEIIATIEGRPYFTNNIFSVNRLYKVDEVSLKTGNVDFVGDVEVTGSVHEGMEIVSGNELFVGENVESARISATGQVVINGNVLNSKVATGYASVERIKYLDNLKNYENVITQLISCAKQIKSNNLLGERSDGEIIKILIENKFKLLSDLSEGILSYSVSKDLQESDIVIFIINKLMGMGPLKIKAFEELENFDKVVKEEIEQMELLIVIPTDIYLEYSQGSTIEASGSVYIKGKGQFNSNITALNNIEFTNESSVCRGGVLSAGSEIKLKTVGSVAGVVTILKVPKEGRITTNIAYNNTIFCFGGRQVVLEVSSKNVEAYVDEFGEIIIDKFIL